MDKKTLKIELRRENPVYGGWYYANLWMPAKDHEIRDAYDRLRTSGAADSALSVSVLECPLLPELTDTRLDSPAMQELNFFAARLAALDETEQTVFAAVAPQTVDLEEEPLSVKDLIKATYGLDMVPVASNVSNDAQLGALVIENEMNEDIAAMLENLVRLLDRQKIGRLQRENDGGVFVGRRYVVAGGYERKEVYDGQHLPETPADKAYVFRLLVSGAFEDATDDWEWLNGLAAADMGMKLMEQTGATETAYGIISARGRSLYEPVSYRKRQAKELTAQSLTEIVNKT